MTRLTRRGNVLGFAVSTNMFSAFTRHISKFWESPDLRADLSRALRCVIAFVVPMLLVGLPGVHSYYIYAALSAQNVTMFDVRGDYRLRLLILLASVFVFTAAGALGAAGAGPNLFMAIGTTIIVALCMGLLRHLNSDYGPGAGITAMLIFLIALSMPDLGGGVPHVWHVAAWTFGGGLWGVLLQCAIWPFRPQHPLRRVVGESWMAAANLFSALKTDDDVGIDLLVRHQAAQSRLAENESILRTALEKAHKTLRAARTERNTDFLKRLDHLSNLADELATRVVSLHTTLTGAIHQNPKLAELDPAFQPILVSLTNTSRTVALAVISRQPQHLALAEVRVRRLGNLLVGYADKVASFSNAHLTAELGVLIGMVNANLTELLFALRATIDRSAERAAFSLELLDVETWSLKPLSSALNLTTKIDPQLLAYTARITVLSVIGIIIAKLAHTPHGYWLVFTMIVVLQPDYGATRQRAAHRVLGTFFGGLLGSALLWVPMPYALQFFLMAATMFIFVSYLRYNYGIAVFFVTLHVVLLTELNQVVTWHFTIERVGYNAAGGVLALIAALLFWPVWERSRIPKTLSDALTANLAYWNNLFALINGPRAADATTTATHRKADEANSNIFASLKRMIGDPANKREGLEEAATIANGSQRLTRALNVIALRMADGHALAHSNIADFGAIGARALQTLATAIAQGGEGSEETFATLATCRRELDAARLLQDLDTTTDDVSRARTRQITGQLARAGTEINAMLLATEKCLHEGVFDATQQAGK